MASTDITIRVTDDLDQPLAHVYGTGDRLNVHVWVDRRHDATQPSTLVTGYYPDVVSLLEQMAAAARLAYADYLDRAAAEVAMNAPGARIVGAGTHRLVRDEGARVMADAAHKAGIDFRTGDES